MKRNLLRTFMVLLAIAAATIGPAWGQNSNVSWVLTPYGDLQDGDTVVIVDKTSARALPNNNGSSAPSAVEIELSGDQNSLSDAPAATLKWVVVLDGGNYHFQKPGTDLEYLYCTSSNNGVRVGTNSANQFTFENGGDNNVPFLKNTSNNRYIGVFNNQDWRCYTTINANIKGCITGFYKRTVSSGGGSGSETPTPGQNATTYTVAGNNADMFGSAWDASYTANDMTINGDGTYSITYTNVYLDADVQYKVVKDHSWDEAYPDGNRVITIAETGTYTVTIHFNPTTHEVYETMPTYTVRLAAGTEDAGNWTLASGNASVQGTQVLENVMSGSQVTATYNGTTKKVKSVKAVKYVVPAATVTTAPTATAGTIAVGSTSALVNAGAANGGTMMYAVTTTNAQPASTADFSATIPTAQGRAKGSYYVWYYAKADADHSDSEIAGPVSVTLAEMITWNSTNVFNSAHENDVTDKWRPNPLTYEGITISFSGTGASTFKPYDDGSQTGSLSCYGNNGDSFTFTAPSGKMFTKIEIIDNSYINFDAYGDWTKPADNKVVWSGTAANAVTLGTVFTGAGDLNRIVFTLIDAQ